jgi:phytoene desaturase
LKKANAIIIGSGVGGLATAVRLATDGFNVTVFEKNNYPGGKLSAFEKDGFLFDAGPSLFTCPFLIEEIFEYANEPIAPYFSYQKLATTCNYFFSDSTTITASADVEKFSKELAAKHHEDEVEVKKYIAQAKQLYTKTGVFFLTHSLHLLSSFFNVKLLKAITGFKLKYISKSLHQYNNNQFKNPKTVQIFNRFATYNGSSPYLAPAMLSLISHLEFNDGVFYPKGGMISITNALYQLAIKKGVKFEFNKEVNEIIEENNIIKGIIANKNFISSAIVVSNGDVYFTYKKLLNDENAANKILKQERSSSALIFYWGINKEFPELDLHNILFTEDYKAEFESIFKTKSIYKDPTVYINITSKLEPTIQAPKGKENWFVMINVPASENINWEKAKLEYRNFIIQKINKTLNTNLEELIETEEVLDPKLIESKTSSYLGSIYGTSSNSIFAAFLRHPNFSSKYNNLYFVGGSVHPGGGIPLCLQSANITNKIIQQKFTSKQP